jgi:sensor histidine kinase regulating citrate/malate metabolism
VNTSIAFEGVVPGNLINPIDICIIFGNAIDNAIEACAIFSDEEKRIITIQSSFKNGFLFIRIDNPAVGNFQIINNSIATTKNESGFHGFGLQSIKTAVNKYYGDVTLSYTNGVFSIEISLDLNMTEEV